MNAQEARELTEQSLKTEEAGVASLLEYVHRKIEGAASKGQRQVTDPLDGLRTPVSARQKALLWEALKREGYTIRHYSELDPRDGGMHVEISW